MVYIKSNLDNNTNITNDDILQYALSNGIINIEDVQEKIAMREKEELLSKHPYKIWGSKDGKWYTYLPDESRGRILKKRNNRKDIENIVIEYIKNQEENKKNPCFGEVYEEWINEKSTFEEIEKNSITRYKSDFKRFFPKDSTFFNIKVREIKDADIEKFVKITIKEKKLSAKSYSGLRLIITGVLKYAKREGYTEYSVSNFFNDFYLPKKIFFRKVKCNNDEIFNKDELKHLITYLWENPTSINYGLILQFLTGIRVGELSSLKIEDNSVNGILRISRTECTYFDEDKNKRITYVKDFPKTENGIRNIILPNSAQELLNLVKEKNPNGDYLFMKNGKRITERMFNYHLQKSCREIGIKPRSTHKVRKTYASLLLSNHIDESIVLNQMGHKNISTTHSYYHYDIAEDQTKIEEINKIMSF